MRRVQVGDPITETLFNDIIDLLTPLANLSASGPYLLCDDHPHYGKSLRLEFPDKTSARLTSNSSPYSWVEVDEAANGTWVTRTVGDSGTNNAYELNNVAGLSGNVYWLTWTAAGDYRFQAIRMGCKLGPCVASIPEVLSFTDTMYGVTMAAIWTPTDPARPCDVGQWIAYNSLAYPGSGGTGGCLQVCPPGTVAMRYRLGFSSTSPFNPTMTVDVGAVAGGCPVFTSTIPDGPWNASITGFSRLASSCTPTFSASFGLTVGNTHYNCHTFPTNDVRILVSTP